MLYRVFEGEAEDAGKDDLEATGGDPAVEKEHDIKPENTGGEWEKRKEKVQNGVRVKVWGGGPAREAEGEGGNRGRLCVQVDEQL